MPKAQATAMISFGLILLVVIILIFLNSGNISNEPTATEAECLEDSIEELENCVFDEMVYKLDLMLAQGGYINLKEASYFNTAYGYNKEIKIPGIEGMENELKNDLEKTIPKDCRFEGNSKNIIATVNLDDSATIKVDWDAVVYCDDTSGKISSVKLNTDLDFEKYYSIIHGLLERGEYTPKYIEDGYYFNKINHEFEESLLEVYDNTTENVFVFRTTIKT